jgi:hypothetical protein
VKLFSFSFCSPGCTTKFPTRAQALCFGFLSNGAHGSSAGTSNTLRGCCLGDIEQRLWRGGWGSCTAWCVGDGLSCTIPRSLHF